MEEATKSADANGFGSVFIGELVRAEVHPTLTSVEDDGGLLTDKFGGGSAEYWPTDVVDGTTISTGKNCDDFAFAKLVWDDGAAAVRSGLSIGPGAKDKSNIKPQRNIGV